MGLSRLGRGHVLARLQSVLLGWRQPRASPSSQHFPWFPSALQGRRALLSRQKWTVPAPGRHGPCRAAAWLPPLALCTQVCWGLLSRSPPEEGNRPVYDQWGVGERANTALASLGLGGMWRWRHRVLFWLRPEACQDFTFSTSIHFIFPLPLYWSSIKRETVYGLFSLRGQYVFSSVFEYSFSKPFGVEFLKGVYGEAVLQEVKSPPVVRSPPGPPKAPQRIKAISVNLKHASWTKKKLSHVRNQFNDTWIVLLMIQSSI